MGLPEIIFKLKEKASTAVVRSGSGVVALILADGTAAGTGYSYGKLADVSSSDWTAENYDYIRLAFLGNPRLVIVERTAAEKTTYTAPLARLANKRFNYLAVPGIATASVKTIADWIIAQRTSKHTFKAVLPNSASDSEGIINFTTDGIKVGSQSYTTAQYCARIAGLLAGIPLSQSATYKPLSEVTAITESSTPGADIDAGKFILISDGENIKCGRGVNSLQTISDGKTADMKKIKITEGIDLIADDIETTFEDIYIGNIANSYDNKQLFVSAIQTYLNDLVSDGVLYGGFDNTAYIDLGAQRKYLQDCGKDVSAMSEEEIKKANTGSKVFIALSIQPEDAMEDLTCCMSIE